MASKKVNVSAILESMRGLSEKEATALFEGLPKRLQDSVLKEIGTLPTGGTSLPGKPDLRGAPKKARDTWKKAIADYNGPRHQAPTTRMAWEGGGGSVEQLAQEMQAKEWAKHIDEFNTTQATARAARIPGAVGESTQLPGFMRGASAAAEAAPAVGWLSKLGGAAKGVGRFAGKALGAATIPLAALEALSYVKELNPNDEFDSEDNRRRMALDAFNQSDYLDDMADMSLKNTYVKRLAGGMEGLQMAGGLAANRLQTKHDALDSLISGDLETLGTVSKRTQPSLAEIYAQKGLL